MLKLANAFYRSVAPSVVKPLHVLWNEVIGFFFFVFAIGTIPAAVRYYRNIDVDPNNLFRLCLAVAFGMLMAYLALSSFLKARKIRRRA